MGATPETDCELFNNLSNKAIISLVFNSLSYDFFKSQILALDQP